MLTIVILCLIYLLSILADYKLTQLYHKELRKEFLMHNECPSISEAIIVFIPIINIICIFVMLIMYVTERLENKPNPKTSEKFFKL